MSSTKQLFESILSYLNEEERKLNPKLWNGKELSIK